MSVLTFEPIRDLDLDETLDCGQCFRWRRQDDGSYCGVVRGRAVRASLDGDRLTIVGADEADRALWADYFDLDRDYAAIRERLSAIHPVMAQAAEYAPGIRILRQEPFEALITFIISQNNHIKRIAGIVQRLCEHFGEPIGGGAYAFPTAGRLAALEPDDLEPIRAGFRHRYIIDAARRVSSGEIDPEALRELPYADARAQLMRINGVGVKVADCVLLYGLNRLDGFPMDVWMKRAMTVLFDGMDPAVFGDCAGIAQQYIFHYSRSHPACFGDP